MATTTKKKKKPTSIREAVSAWQGAFAPGGGVAADEQRGIQTDQLRFVQQLLNQQLGHKGMTKLDIEGRPIDMNAPKYLDTPRGGFVEHGPHSWEAGQPNAFMPVSQPSPERVYQQTGIDLGDIGRTTARDAAGNTSIAGRYGSGTTAPIADVTRPGLEAAGPTGPFLSDEKARLSAATQGAFNNALSAPIPPQMLTDQVAQEVPTFNPTLYPAPSAMSVEPHVTVHTAQNAPSSTTPEELASVFGGFKATPQMVNQANPEWFNNPLPFPLPKNQPTVGGYKVTKPRSMTNYDLQAIFGAQ